MEELILYEIVFTDESGNDICQDVWAHFETEALRKAEDIAYEYGYTSYRLKEE